MRPVEGGVLGAVSVGFRPIESDTGARRRPDIHFVGALEPSVVSVPCDADALVIARSMQGKAGRVLNARNSAALAEVERCLGKSAEAHEAACELLEKSERHREKARRHAGNYRR